jgi:hypothetical protein
MSRVNRYFTRIFNNWKQNNPGKSVNDFYVEIDRIIPPQVVNLPQPINPPITGPCNDGPISTSVQNALNLKANILNPTFSGIVSGISKVDVGLENVDNTSDENKPLSKNMRDELANKATIVYLNNQLNLKADKGIL